MGRIGGLLMLYGSRLASVLVSLVVIPSYARHLGSHDFGLVALLLSSQAMMLMLDLGMSGLMSRDLASNLTDGAAGAAWRRAEHLLTVYFLALAVPILAVAYAAGESLLLALSCVVLLWTLTLQNLAHAAMVARGDVRLGALLQGAGVLGRAAFTLSTLVWIECSLRAFVGSQLLGALAHLIVNRQMGQPPFDRAVVPEPLTALARRGLPLFLVGAIGAAALQADKLIVGTYIGPSAVTPYFLATTFCLTPISILAGPVAQYFQPGLVRAFSDSNSQEFERRVAHLTTALLVTVIVPTTLLWLARKPIIAWWLHDGPLADQVATLAGLLLPAAAIGAIGNAPLAMLNSLADFGFQVRMSVVITLLTLLAVTWAAQRGDLPAICAIYLIYYVVVTTTFWLRAGSQPFTAKPARRSATLTAATVAMVWLPVALLTR